MTCSHGSVDPTYRHRNLILTPAHADGTTALWNRCGMPFPRAWLALGLAARGSHRAAHGLTRVVVAAHAIDARRQPSWDPCKDIDHAVAISLTSSRPSCQDAATAHGWLTSRVSLALHLVTEL